MCVVIAVLVAISLPTVRGVLLKGRNTATLANLRTHASAVTAYSTDNGDWTPVFLEPGYSSSLDADGITVDRLHYFDMHRVWHIPLARTYYGVEYSSPVFQSPSDPQGYEMRSVFTVYSLACVFFAKPAYWNPSTRLVGSSQFGSNRLSDVVYPSGKSFIIESHPFESLVTAPSALRDARLPTATVDGSARSLAMKDRLPGYERGDGYINQSEGAVHYQDFPPLLHTLDGIRGRDRAN